ncbi:MAG: sulfite exporter TauE/SafE family protein [Propionibacteriaceae bacterium]|nr:sulfite exporter TauE/SafE family protein [Propionibacteriaceae bacterium]
MNSTTVSGRRILTYVILGLVAGALSGMFGVGGGIIIVPLLVMLAHFAQRRAQATSLSAIVIIACAGAIPYVARTGMNWPVVAIIAAGGITGSFIGSSLVQRIHEGILKVIFALVALTAAIQLILPRMSGTSDHFGALTLLSVGEYVLAGLAMGLLSPLVGVGGGVVLVPLLIFLVGLQQHVAQGISLVVLVPVSLMGSVRGARVGNVDWLAAACLGVGGVVASPLAAQLALGIPSPVLSALFAILLLVSAIQIGVAGITALRKRRHPVDQEGTEHQGA